MVATLGQPLAQRRVIRVESGRKSAIQQLKDSTLKADSTARILADSLQKTAGDSLIKPTPAALIALTRDSLQTDSIAVDTSFLARQGSVVMLSPEEQKRASQASQALKKELDRRNKFSFTRDTISAGNLTMLSFVPGLGQVYNRQWWKLPVFYAGIGGFATAGLLFNNSYKTYKADYLRAVDLNLPREMKDLAQSRMARAGSSRTLFFSMAAATYLYSVADATFNYRGKVNPIRKATTLAAIFPGMGFVYTKTYWRIPIYYGGFIAVATVIDYNNRNYQRYKRAYNALTDGNPATKDEFNGHYSPEMILNARNAYRRDRDLAIIGMAAIYVLSIVDTHVIATLKNWDISDDLSINVEPTIINNNLERTSSVPQGYGMAVKIKF